MTARPPAQSGLPGWLTITVVLVILGLLVFNIGKYGPDGFATTSILGGLLGAYGGVNELIKSRRRNDDEKGPPP